MQRQKIHYPKHWVDVPAQIRVLESRGLAISDSQSAAEFLSYINYYRFTGYCLRFQTAFDASGNRLFAQGTTFEDVRDLCDIDKALRDVFADGLEMIEISIKAATADVFGGAYDALGHLDRSHFAASFTAPAKGSKPGDPTAYEVWRAKLQGETRRSRELFVTHFKDQYLEYPDLPIWMACEVASFGSVSRLYDNMLKGEMKGIAQRYGLQPTFLASFLHAFVYLRNVCAHHSRLWDKSLSIKPQLPPGKLWDDVRKAPANSLFPAASAIYWMLGHDSIAAASQQAWRESLEKVMMGFARRFPAFVRFTGFPEDWRTLALWK